jgi:hypothetical protein
VSLDVDLVCRVAAVISMGCTVRGGFHFVGPRPSADGGTRWVCESEFENDRESDGPTALRAFEEWDRAVLRPYGVDHDTSYADDWSAAGAAMVFVRAVGNDAARIALDRAMDVAVETRRTGQ